jgi:nucleotide-binding universal stress UspA family protein
MRCILAATDGSESANRAIDVAAQLAQRFDATLLIVNAVNHDVLSTAEMNKYRQVEGISLGEALASMSSDILMQAERQARKHGLTSVKTESREGDAAQVVTEIMRETGVDAVVVGRRGRGQVAGLLLGSISQKLVTLAPCMVIVVP